MFDFDYVIVGAGSAGCVLANRLSEDGSRRVCLIEAGKSDDSLLVRMPVGVAAILPTRIRNWAFQTLPQPGLGGRRGYQPRGKMLGGSSSMNAMIYIRGQREDYDGWAAGGCTGWGWHDVLPYFRKAEHQERGDDDFHAVGGPLNVADLRSPNPLSRAFVEAARELQVPVNPDFNGPVQEGAGFYQVTQKDGERCSAARAYLAPVHDRANLRVITGARVSRILFDGRRAVGVAYRHGGTTRVIRVGAEVILAAGALQSPQLLQLSGIGDGAMLRRHGIEVFHDLPSVGQHLQDHIDYVTSYRCRTRDAFGISLGGMPILLRAIGEYRRERKGLLTSNFAEAGAFLRSDLAVERPDLQLHFVVGIVDDHSRKLHLGHGYSCHVCLLRPKSEGSVYLQSADPFSAPAIDPNYLGEEEDLDTLVKGFRIMRRILEAPALAPYRGREFYTADVQDDAAIRAAIRARADTVYHPVGSCRMGTGEDAVVDPELKVWGVERLRVVDASVMPRIVSGNTNAPTIMIAEKAAEMIRVAA